MVSSPKRALRVMTRCHMTFSTLADKECQVACLHICSLHSYGCLVSGGIEPTRRESDANWARLAVLAQALPGLGWMLPARS